MSEDKLPEAPGEHAPAIPRDLPDQQAQGGPDPLDIDGGTPQTAAPPHRPEDVPDLDEPGTRRRGKPHSGGVHPEQPVPDEPSG
ncbi:hypothetical protein [Streptomyces botrytidirepellens]|uniref:hypothetical protein n=1 Tax=Streptomyces botrytidirepellens TaxID=2486417 RepID=UPI0016217CB7|nr:hypothetical protein [Streptomyces botrytidirepellens]